MFRMPVNEAGQVEYRALIGALNWRQAAPPTAAAAAAAAVNHPDAGPGAPAGGRSNEQQVQVVRADALMQDLTA